MGTLIVLALVFAENLDKSLETGRYALVGIGLLLVLTVLAATVFVIRLGSLRSIAQRLEYLLERYFHDASQVRSIPRGDECAQISFALQLLEESMDARERSERELRQQEQISASILRALHQSVVVADSRGCITLFSQGAEAMLGYSADEVVGKQTPMLFHDPDEVRKRAEELTEELCLPVVADTYTLIAKALATGQVDEREWTYIRKDGTRLTVLSSITVFFDDHGNVMCCCVATDMTERSRAMAEISRLANYDPLTQLPNRRLFHDRIHMAIIQARRKNAKFGLLMIDLDRFKPVNDKYGHSIGDMLLSAVAERMQKSLRESDTLARLGGDEFVAILPVIEEARDAAKVAKKIRRALCSPFDLTCDVTVSIDCSIGIAIYPDHGGDGDSLLKSADDAMYVAKSQGRTKVYFARGAVDTAVAKDDRQDDHLAANRRDDHHVEPLLWRPAYECGEETIDRQHKAIFTFCNSSILAIENGDISLAELPEIFARFISEAVSHFQYEESMLSRFGYPEPEFEAHRKQHQALHNQMKNLHRLALAREVSIDEVMLFIEWNNVVQHILMDDHEYFQFLKKALQQNQDSAETP
ncbi:MAG: diguanylate cyclase [Candidatus Accumulibacter sp.]|nr:diguanylate cyclase [Accumulibacter sp.]